MFAGTAAPDGAAVSACVPNADGQSRDGADQSRNASVMDQAHLPQRSAAVILPYKPAPAGESPFGPPDADSPGYLPQGSHLPQ